MHTKVSRSALSAALLLSPATIGAQTMSVETLTPPATFDQAIGISPNGQFVVGGGGTNGFLWSEVEGLTTGFGLPFEAWGVADDGETIVGTFLNGSGQTEAGLWTPSGGVGLLGSPSPTGCGSDVSHLFGLDGDGDVGVGMAWEGCRTTPIRWTPSTGLTYMAKQNADSSARANRVSADGQVAVGWDQGLSTGQGFSRRASVWLDPNTQVFPATTPTNLNGLGECADVNSDGSVVCGTTQNSAFVWTIGGGLNVLPPVTGFGGQYYANGVSDDGSIAVGVRIGPCCPPTLDAVIWTPGGGAMRLFDMLSAAGVTGYSASDFQNATDISADGSVISGWGGGDAWIVRIGTWHDIGVGGAGASGQPTLAGTGDLSMGSSLQLDLSGAASSSVAAVIIGLSNVNLPLNGATLVPFPDFLDVGVTDGSGNLTKSYPIPGLGFPPGTKVYAQEWVSDATGPFGWTSSNALLGVTQ